MKPNLLIDISDYKLGGCYRYSYDFHLHSDDCFPPFHAP